MTWAKNNDNFKKQYETVSVTTIDNSSKSNDHLKFPPRKEKKKMLVKKKQQKRFSCENYCQVEQ